jgi:hypothetical protein
MEQPSIERNPVWAWVSFVVIALVGTGLCLLPFYIIRPFRYQGPRALWLAMAVRQHAPLGTLLAALLCGVLTAMLWRAARMWQRTALTTGMALVLLSVVMARMNHFEWMFHPVRQPGFEAASQTKLDSSEMVLALGFNGDTRAYPIREMAYHHIVNDLVGGVPVAVTY